LRFWRWLNPEIVIGFLCASIFWTFVLGWQAAYAPTDLEKQECRESANKAGYKTEECKSLWERTTSDPVAFFTLVLSISTIGLWIATVLGSRRQSGDMETVASIAEKQLSISALQTDIQKKQHAVTRIQTLTTHRPKLRVRNIVIDRPQVGQKPLRFFDPSQPVCGSLEIVNIGGSAARIVDCYWSVWWNRPGSSWDLPMKHPYSGRPGQVDRPKNELAAGESIFATFKTERPPPDSIWGVDTINGSKAFVMGWIEYTDSLDVGRITRFCREYVASAVGAEGRFRAVNDSDYEYED
jgi:hypothetical protein